MIEKIPIKFHVEGNKLIFDEMWIILTGDKVVIEHSMDENGVIHYTKVWIERRITS
ncbi:MAG TPA: hypothetical protein VF870_08730 [Ignavibacteriaceae bacterium]